MMWTHRCTQEVEMEIRGLASVQSLIHQLSFFSFLSLGFVLEKPVVFPTQNCLKVLKISLQSKIAGNRIRHSWNSMPSGKHVDDIIQL